MIPKKMEALLRARLPEQTWTNRLIQEDGCCFMEFTASDVDRLARLGIEVDELGPNLVVCMWDEESALEVGGFLAVDNLAMGRPAMGGIRMLADITPATVCGLARGMTMKNAASNLPFGGGKVGIIADRSLTRAEHNEIVRRFARLLSRYRSVLLPGPDVGTDDADMMTIAVENGLDTVVSKPIEMGGSQSDQLGAAAGGLVIALKALLDEMPRLRSLPQFASLEIPHSEDLSIIVQGFGAVGANTARQIHDQLFSAKVTGISDALGYLYDPQGLPVVELFEMRMDRVSVTRPYFNEVLVSDRWGVSQTKYCSAPNDLLCESAFCMIPASPVSNYLDLDENSQPSITVDRMGKWTVIVEGANTYSPEKSQKARRKRMEREVYRKRGVLIAPDFLVNSGGVIFAAQEQLIKTPDHLRIPGELLGDRPAVEKWLQEHVEELSVLAEQRRKAAGAAREEVIRRNMRELVDMLVSDPDLLPCEAAETISIRRAMRRERSRTAAEIMTSIPTITEERSIREAAALLVETRSSLLAVVSEDGLLTGVISDWDVTRSAAQGISKKQPLSQIMTRAAIVVKPDENILEMLRKLEHQEISAMPVVADGVVLGMVSSDLLAQQTLMRLLQSELS